jgi:uncharacterized protein (TIGR03437 family)
MLKTPLLFMAVSAAFSQGIVTTVAGTDYIFPDDGRPALQAHLSTPYGLVFDRQGTLIIADPGLNMILKMDAKGTISIVAGNGLARYAGDGGPARAASISQPWGIAVDSAGNLYFADSNNGRIRKIDSAGIITTVAGGGGPTPGDGSQATQVTLVQPVAVAFDPSGNMLILERGNTRLRSVNKAGVISTIAGNGTLTFAGDGGPATSASLQAAEGLTVAPDGTIYIADANNGAVRKIDTKGIITTFAGRGPDPNAAGGTATGVALFQPTAVALDPQGNLYIAENSGNRARRVSPQGILTNLAGTGQPGFSGDGGAAIQAKFAQCFGITLDSGGNAYISDRLNGRIRRVDANGTVTTVAGVGRFVGDGGPAANAVLSGPDESGSGQIGSDPQGNIYVADRSAHRIRKITPDGGISTIVGTGIAGVSQDGTPAISALIKDPSAMAVDPQGNLVFIDAGNDLIRRVDSSGNVATIAGFPDVGFSNAIAIDKAGNIYYQSEDNVGDFIKKVTPTSVVSTIAGTGKPGYSGDGGPASSAAIGQVGAGMVVDSTGNLLFSDSAFNVIRRIDTKGIITTIAGTGTRGDSGDGGPASKAALSCACGLTLDSSGNLFVTSGSRIRRIGTDGTITAWAGNGKFGFTGDGGPALNASFAFAYSLTMTPQNVLAVADINNRRVRLIQPTATNPSIIASQNGLTFVASTGSGAPGSQSFTVVNGGTGTLNYGATPSTASGGNWLSVTPAAGSAASGAAGPPVQVSVNPTGLTAGDYYGQLQVQAPGAPNSPQTVTVVLNVRAPGSAVGSIVQPSGLIFTSATLQTLTLTTVSTTPVNFTGTASFGGAPFFNLQPASGTVVAGKSTTVQVVPFLTGLGNGVYNGNITFAFSDSSVQNVQALLVLSPGSGNRPNAPGTLPATCAPSKLLPVFTSFGTGFSLTTGWPSPVELRVVDDCGQPFTRGTGTATFSNTDPALTLNSLGDGRWTGTWIAQNATANVSVTASAQSMDKSLNGTSQVNGGLGKNANPPPVVAPGGVLNAASYQLQAPLAPGSLVSIFGSLLSQGSVSAPALPLTNTLSGTTVTIAGRSLPLLFAGPNQVNAMIPYDLPINATHQLVVQRGTAISIPQPVSVLSSQSGVFTKDLTGNGAGIVVRATADGTEAVVSTDNPAHVFDALVIYCAGLGDVDPRQIAGQQATFAPLSQTIDTVKVTIGGIDAPVVFAGLTPGFTGLYQVNAYVPVGVTPGDNVPLIITQAGRTSPPVSIAVR